MKIKYYLSILFVFLQFSIMTADASPKINYPIADSLITKSNQTFTIDTNGINLIGWELYVGTNPNEKDITTSKWIDGKLLSHTFKNFPINGKTVYLTLWGLPSKGNWIQYESIGYMTSGDVDKAKLFYIPMHYELLNQQPIVRDDITLNNINSYALKGLFLGRDSIELENTYGLLPNQLITIKTDNGDHFVRKIKDIVNDLVSFTEPLYSTVKTGKNIWDFYSDEHHPNTHGLTAIADFALKKIDLSGQKNKRHVLLGDSWFAKLYDVNIPSAIEQRLIDKIPNSIIINKGVGGDTCQKLLERFDKDVTTQNPDYVWIMCGTNDYIGNNITPETKYRSNVKDLILKTQKINAIPIIIDTSVGKGDLKLISDTYANVIKRIYENFLKRKMYQKNGNYN